MLERRDRRGEVVSCGGIVSLCAWGPCPGTGILWTTGGHTLRQQPHEQRGIVRTRCHLQRSALAPHETQGWFTQRAPGRCRPIQRAVDRLQEAFRAGRPTLTMTLYKTITSQDARTANQAPGRVTRPDQWRCARRAVGSTVTGRDPGILSGIGAAGAGGCGLRGGPAVRAWLAMRLARRVRADPPACTGTCPGMAG